MTPFLLPFALLLQTQGAPLQDAPKPEAKAAVGAPTSAPGGDRKPLSFLSQKFPFQWNVLLPLNVEVDGLKLKTIFFNRRESTFAPLRGTDFGTRAQIEVTNTALKPRIPGFAVAVFDEAGSLIGVASGGTKFGTVKPGTTETFDLNFRQVYQRLPRGASFVLSVELVD